MTEYLYPALFALFVWWLSTGVIFYLDGLPRRTFRWSMLGATLVLVGSLYGLLVSSADASVTGAYVAFTCGLLAWGWQQMSFYMGYVTGPRTEPSPEGCGGWRHFGHAIQTSLYHELAIVAAAVAIFALTWGEPNQVGVWTFMVLWWMHLSAKLNVFLGVTNLNEEFLPDHMAFLKSFLTKKPMNLLFPVSVTVSTVIAVVLVQNATAPGVTPFEAAGYTFLATLMVLAILEHWFLVLPVPAAALWSWSLKSRATTKPFDVEIVAGFLGAGKTTFLRRRLGSAECAVGTVALVNDFSDVGVDASLLRGRGADVVELPNGCICCSLREDLAGQLEDIVSRMAPERILIEPSGVADIGSLLRALEGSELKPLIRSLRMYSMIDAGAFLEDYARMPEYFEMQAALSPVFILNKADLVSAAELDMVKSTLRALNPGALAAPATYGLVEASELPEEALGAPPLAVEPDVATGDDRAAYRHRQHHREDALGLQSWSAPLSGRCDPKSLRDLLDAVALGAFGEIDRVKGIVRAGSGWVHFDVAGGRASMAAFAPGELETPRVVAIGQSLERTRLKAAFEACAISSAA